MRRKTMALMKGGAHSLMKAARLTDKIVSRGGGAFVQECQTMGVQKRREKPTLAGKGTPYLLLIFLSRKPMRERGFRPKKKRELRMTGRVGQYQTDDGFCGEKREITLLRKRKAACRVNLWERHEVETIVAFQKRSVQRGRGNVGASLRENWTEIDIIIA